MKTYALVFELESIYKSESSGESIMILIKLLMPMWDVSEAILSPTV